LKQQLKSQVCSTLPVNKTGKSMEQIEEQITAVAQKIDAISRASREQATGLSQVNTALNEMDTMTQKNAAMVQDSNTASQKLAGECERLADVVRSFKLTGTAALARPSGTPRPAPAAAAKAVAPRPSAQPQYQTQGNAALAQSSETWEEF
jgi:methyl-accepting chemotaxis protein